MDYLFLLRDQSLFSLYGTEIAVLNERSWMSSITIPVGRQEIYLWTILDIYYWTKYGGDNVTISSCDVQCYRFDVQVVTV